MNRLEQLFLTAGAVGWLLGLLAMFGLLPIAGTLSLDLYRLYSIGAVLGWLTGNVYVARRRLAPGTWRRRLLTVYLLLPPGYVFLLRFLAPVAEQRAAPLVPLYAVCVSMVFFFVPLTFGRRPS